MSEVRWPALAGSPVLDSVRPVIENSREVHVDLDRLANVAGWMAYEDLPMPDYVLPLGLGEGDPEETIDFILTTACVDTAFTDFHTQIKFQLDYAGRSWSDSGKGLIGGIRKIRAGCWGNCFSDFDGRN